MRLSSLLSLLLRQSSSFVNMEQVMGAVSFYNRGSKGAGRIGSDCSSKQFTPDVTAKIRHY